MLEEEREVRDKGAGEREQNAELDRHEETREGRTSMRHG
jgi:hypothetical protein